MEDTGEHLDKTFELSISEEKKDEAEKSTVSERHKRRKIGNSIDDRWKKKCFNDAEWLYRKLNYVWTKKGTKVEQDFNFRPATRFTELDKLYLHKIQPITKEDVSSDHIISGFCWNFEYPPNKLARLHCAKIIYEALGQPDHISMRRTHSNYEVCEVYWIIEKGKPIPDCFQNWHMVNDLPIVLPSYNDNDDQVEFTETYVATFKIINRNFEVFSTKNWSKPSASNYWNLKELKDVFKRNDDQCSILKYINK